MSRLRTQLSSTLEESSWTRKTVSRSCFHPNTTPRKRTEKSRQLLGRLWPTPRDLVPQSVQSLSRVRLFATPWTAARQASRSITNSRTLLKFMSIQSVMPSNHPILCRSPSPPAFYLSQHRGLFKWVSASHQVAKVLDFQLQHQSFQWTPRTALLEDGLVGSPCSPRDSQESSPTPQFKSIHSSALSFL